MITQENERLKSNMRAIADATLSGVLSGTISSRLSLCITDKTFKLLKSMGSDTIDLSEESMVSEPIDFT